MFIHFSELFHSAKRPFLYSSFYSNYPGAKSVVRQELNEFCPPNSSDNPVPSLLSVSSYMVYCSYNVFACKSAATSRKRCLYSCTVTTIFAATYHRYHILNKLTFTISLGGEINGMLGLPCWLDAVS